VSLAISDPVLHEVLEPGTEAPRARLDLVGAIASAGLPCNVMVAPVLPWLTNSTEALDELLRRIATAGATSATVLALHLWPGVRPWFLDWLRHDRPLRCCGHTVSTELHRHGNDPHRPTLGRRAIVAADPPALL